MRITREQFNSELGKRGLLQRDFVKLCSAKGFKALSIKLHQQNDVFTVWCSLAVSMFFDLYDAGGFDG